MSDAIIKAIEEKQIRTDLPEVSVGDTVDVHVKIIEGAKERIQVFSGVVLKIQGGGINRTFTVRRIVANEGVERTFPFASPRIDKINIVRSGHTRRAKLYYLRERVGKKRRLRDRRRGLGRATAPEVAAAPAESAE
ncbi:50S ribosomal protein L19 [Poriferisphaera sp. WC338]|uniref:50S ribosomal protein L19 n=1 Tax=Poriferisphaera sp. WC338 TaxID=3425129 RepID=UPI003D81BCEF